MPHVCCLVFWVCHISQKLRRSIHIYYIYIVHIKCILIYMYTVLILILVLFFHLFFITLHYIGHDNPSSRPTPISASDAGCTSLIFQRPSVPTVPGRPATHRFRKCGDGDNRGSLHTQNLSDGEIYPKCIREIYPKCTLGTKRYCVKFCIRIPFSSCFRPLFLAHDEFVWCFAKVLYFY